MFALSLPKFAACLAFAATLALSACAHREAPAAIARQESGAREAGRLLYEIVVQAPGSRSQGWRGILYDPQGAPITLRPGESIDTNLGTFVGIECRRLWDVCGAVHQDTLDWMHEHSANVILGAEPSFYRVFVDAECTRSEAWRGELRRDGQIIAPAPDELQTPMGPFVAKSSAFAFGQHGWFPVSWPEPDPGAGHWPCRSS